MNDDMRSLIQTFARNCDADLTPADTKALLAIADHAVGQCNNKVITAWENGYREGLKTR